jgi:hypothetical protein
MTRLPLDPKPCKISLSEALSGHDMAEIRLLIEEKRIEQQRHWENATAYIVADTIGCSVKLAMATAKRSRYHHTAEQKARFIDEVLREMQR